MSNSSIAFGGGQMKKIIIILPMALIFCFMVGCQDKAAMDELEEFRAQAALEEANMDLAARLAKAFKEHNIEAMKEIYSPDLISHRPQGDSSLDESLEIMKQEFVMFPDWTLSTEDLFVKGNKVVWRGTYTGTNTGDIEGFPATGKKFEASCNIILRVGNGKVVEEWFEYDNLGVYQQLGFELKSKEEK
jgi:predicted ester cyclase